MKVVCRRGNEVHEASVGVLTGDSLLSSPEFASLWEHKGGRRAVWSVEEAGRLLGVLAGIEFGRRPVRRFLAMPHGLYGRVFIEKEHSDRNPEIGFELMRAIIGGGYCKIHVYDFYRDALPEDGPFRSRLLNTTLVDISDREWEPPDRKLRGEIRKAAREGVTIERFDWKEHGGGFMDLARGAQGDAKYPESFWHRLAEVAARDNRIRWYYCGREKKPVASQVYFVEGDMLLGWQMYYDRAFSELKANPFMIFHAAAEARERGVRILNLGATPAGARGTTFFKDRWGGKEHTYRELSCRKGVGRVL